MNRSILFSAIIALPFAAGGAFAQSSSMSAPSTTGATHVEGTGMAGSSGKLSEVDREFVMKAAQGGTAEVDMAKLAQEKAGSGGVKTFAQHMIDDHTPNNEQLMKLAQQKGLSPVAEPNSQQQAMMTKLQGMSGTAFDHAYLSGQVKSHQQMLKLFEREATNGTDPDLKSFAETTVPVIQKHITMAQNAG